jgi:hypothetical protein
MINIQSFTTGEPPESSVGEYGSGWKKRAAPMKAAVWGSLTAPRFSGYPNARGFRGTFRI